MSALETRVNTTGSAGALVPTEHRPQDYIQPLRNRLLARRLGVRVLSGLHGNVSIPKHGTGVSTGWVAENSAVPDSTVAPVNVTLTPKHARSEEHTSELQSLMRNSYAAFCLTK